MLACKVPPSSPTERLSFGSARGAFLIAAVVLQGQAEWGRPDEKVRGRFVDAALQLADEDPDGFRELRAVVVAGSDICVASRAVPVPPMRPYARALGAAIDRSGAGL